MNCVVTFGTSSSIGSISAAPLEKSSSSIASLASIPWNTSLGMMRAVLGRYPCLKSPLTGQMNSV